jgi:multiple sugar transport system substrate-binding protein
MALAALVVLAISSIASAGTGVTTLSMWARSDDAAWLPNVVNEYNSTHKNIQLKLTLVPYANLVQKYSAAASGGSGPDVAVVEISLLPQFVQSGWLQDLTSRAHGLSYYSKFSAAHKSQATYKGSLYALPFSGDVSVLYWNKDLFRQAGLNANQPPRTWAEIARDAKKIRALGSNYYGYFFSGACGGCMSFTMLPYVWANGGEVLKPSGGASFSPNSQLAAALRFYRRLWTNKVVPIEAQTEGGSDQFGPFFSGKTGMFVQGTFPYGVLRKDHPSVHFGVTLVPSTDGKRAASFAGGDDLAITKTAHTSEAWAVLRWMTSQGQVQLANFGVLPTRSDIGNSQYARSDPRNAVFVKALQVGHAPRSVKVNALLFSNNSPWATLLQNAIFKGQDIRAAMRQAQSQADQILK